MKISFSALTLAALLIAGMPLMAHHGTGVSYDASKPVQLKGVVTEFRYANPHPQLFFDVKDDKGTMVHWSGEFYPNPAQLVQLGWGKKRSEAALAPGTVINVTVAPARAGGPVGALMRLADEKDEVLLAIDTRTTPGAPPPPAPGQKKE
ncbi:MAG: DUF6152 family protein [Bryobacteraceae bacterium]